MKLNLASSPHLRAKRDTSQVMRLVLYAMLPGIACQVVFFGWGSAGAGKESGLPPD